jgi:hypothetical protein
VVISKEDKILNIIYLNSLITSFLFTITLLFLSLLQPFDKWLGFIMYFLMGLITGRVKPKIAILVFVASLLST